MIQVSGQSINGRVTYEVMVDVQLPEAARELLRDYVIRHVRANYGVTPAGISWLLDPRTVTTTIVRQTTGPDETEEVSK